MAERQFYKDIMAGELRQVERELEQPVLLEEACKVLIEDLESQRDLTAWKKRNVTAQIKNLREIVQYCRTLKSAQKGL
jgi:hypothetical protein